MTLRILKEATHERVRVDPFGQLPCEHETIVVHTTNGESLGDDILECPLCGYATCLSDLYAAVRMPPLSGTTS